MKYNVVTTLPINTSAAIHRGKKAKALSYRAKALINEITALASGLVTIGSTVGNQERSDSAQWNIRAGLRCKNHF